MAEPTALSDKSNMKLVEQPKKDSYAKGFTVEDAYRFLNNAGMKPVQLDSAPSQ